MREKGKKRKGAGARAPRNTEKGTLGLGCGEERVG